MSVPKTACTKVKWTLHQLEGYQVPAKISQLHHRKLPDQTFLSSLADFTTAEAVEILHSTDWFRFCFVRNPYERLFSAYKSKILWGDDQYQSVREEIRIKSNYPSINQHPAGTVAFRDFVKYVEATPDELRDAHWRTQTGILLWDMVHYDFVGKFESFVEDFTKVLQRLSAPDNLLDNLPQKINKTPPINLAVAFDRTLANHVYEIYKDDFVSFDYDIDSWLFSTD